MSTARNSSAQRQSARAPASQKTDAAANGAAETPERDGPVLDLTDQAVKKLIKTGKARGYVTYDELNAVLPSEEFSSDQLEDIMAMFNEMGVNVVEQEEDDEGAEAVDDTASNDEEESRAIAPQAVPARAETRAEPTERAERTA